MSILAKSLQRIKGSLHLTKVHNQIPSNKLGQKTDDLSYRKVAMLPIVSYRESKPASISFFVPYFFIGKS